MLPYILIVSTWVVAILITPPTARRTDNILALIAILLFGCSGSIVAVLLLGS